MRPTALLVAAALSSVMTSSSVLANVIGWTLETSSISINNTTHMGSVSLGGSQFSFTDYGNVGLAFYNDNPGSNSQASIADFIKSSNLFGLTPITVLQNSVSNDNVNQNGFVITGASPAFNYLAVHIGGGEMLFHWSTAVSDFTLNGPSLSNYRAYVPPGSTLSSTQPGVVPEPGTVPLVFAGLGLLGLMLRRRQQA